MQSTVAKKSKSRMYTARPDMENAFSILRLRWQLIESIQKKIAKDSNNFLARCNAAPFLDQWLSFNFALRRGAAKYALGSHRSIYTKQH